MSRIGKTAHKIPAGVEVMFNAPVLTVKGAKGTLTRMVSPEVTITVNNGEIAVNPANSSQLAKKLWGTFASHAQNMIEGVTKGFQKVLIIEGVGFKSELKGTTIVMRLGFSHPVEVVVPEMIKAQVKDNIITLDSHDKDALGQFAAKVRSLKKPEPYKGKGIRYKDEVIRRKEGKKAAK